MVQCRCITGVGRQCSRNAENNSMFCWQHKACKKMVSATSSSSSSSTSSSSSASIFSSPTSTAVRVTTKKLPKKKIEKKVLSDIDKLYDEVLSNIPDEPGKDRKEKLIRGIEHSLETYYNSIGQPLSAKELDQMTRRVLVIISVILDGAIDFIPDEETPTPKIWSQVNSMEAVYEFLSAIYGDNITEEIISKVEEHRRLEDKSQAEMRAYMNKHGRWQTGDTVPNIPFLSQYVIADAINYASPKKGVGKVMTSAVTRNLSAVLEYIIKNNLM